ncbi:MAG TPA: glycine--tRNA ligase subunit beta [Gallionellaceae bacterium]
MSQKSLLVELFVEELPPKALKKLGESFAAVLADTLKAQGLVANGGATAYASPRRLAVRVEGVAAKAADKQVAQKLMPVSVGLDASGQATPALLKKLAALGVGAETVPQLRREGEGKAESLVYDSKQSGVTLAEGLQLALQEALAKLPIPKVMTYQLADGWSNVQFVRPAHRLVALHGADIVPVEALGLKAGRTTQGHRFEAAAATLDIRDADSYEAQMENEGAVIPSFEKRRAEISRQLAEAAAKAGSGLQPIADDALLDEVTGLVERPNVLLCQFDAQFLEVPQECLILTMKANQKYFPLLDANGKLTNQFLLVSNIRPQDASAVIGGNERVVRPRLADAKFFYDQDRKKTLESRVLGLAKVVYHNKLGTQGERVQRVCAIAKAIGQQLGGESLAMQAEQAALLAKADLLTDMVGEFPELQGIMGRYYAQHDGLGDDIAYAIEDHYKPRFAGDELPRNRVGICVALADKMETLAGLFSIGQIPTGDKDPFALRRHALGIIRMVAEKDVPIRLNELLGAAKGSFPEMERSAIAQVEDFIYERLAGFFREQEYSALEVEAVLTLRPQNFGDAAKRLAAVRAFTSLPEAAALAAANKRVGNILKKAEGAATGSVNQDLLVEPSEQALMAELSVVMPEVRKHYDAGNYTASLKALAALKAPVDAFFDHVMVNAEDAKLRANRLALLAQLHTAMNRVADISRLAA